jgi:hypothetical protein
MSEEGAAGRCISCGFLAYRPEISRLGFEYQEVEPHERETPEKFYRPPKPKPPPRPPSRDPWTIPTSPPVMDVFSDGYLVCFRRRFDLPKEMKSAQTKHDPATGQAISSVPVHVAVREVLLSDRRCPEYVQYVAGLTPKDHLLERRVSALEEDRRSFQAALETQNMGLARQGRNLAVAAIIVGALIGGAQILTMTSESVLYRLGAAIYRHFVPAPPPTPPPPLGGI